MVAGNEFEIVLPKDEDERFIDALLKDSSAPMNVFANLRIENAKAYEKKDEDMIMGKVDASAGGRAKVSGHAKATCEWKQPIRCKSRAPTQSMGHWLEPWPIH